MKRYLAIGVEADDGGSFSARVELDPATIGDTPSCKCEAAQLAADQLMEQRPGFIIDRLWLVSDDLKVVGDWRKDGDFDCPAVED